MKRFLCIAVCATFVCGAAVVNADDPKPEKKTKVQAEFEKLDSDQDGQLSSGEFCVDKDGKPLDGKKKENKEKTFKKYDVDSSNSLSLDEFKLKGKKPKEPKN